MKQVHGLPSAGDKPMPTKVVAGHADAMAETQAAKLAYRAATLADRAATLANMAASKEASAAMAQAKAEGAAMAAKEATSRSRVITMSQGGTATHAFFEALCSQGIPAVHWQDHCHVREEELSAHHRTVQAYARLRDCLVSENKNAQECSGSTIANNLRGAITNVLANYTFSLADTPYPNAVKFIIGSPYAKGVRFLVSHREPAAWAYDRKRRADPLCTLKNVNPFDLLECAFNCGSGRVKDCMASEKSLYNHAQLESAFATGQGMLVRSTKKANATVLNLFEQNESFTEIIARADGLARALKLQSSFA
jgi:hypothetical protein